MIYIWKTNLSQTLSKCKKLLDKKENLMNFFIINNTLSINVANQHIIYHSNLDIRNENDEDTSELIYFQIDGRALEVALKGRNREIGFDIKEGAFTSEELGLNLVPVNYSEGGKYNNLSNFPYQDLGNSTEFIDTFFQMNELFFSSTAHYADFLKLSDMNATIFNSELFCNINKSFNEDMLIDKTFGNEGLSLHKKAVNFFVQNTTRNTNLKYLLIKNHNLFILKNEEEYFCFKFSDDVTYPSPADFNPQLNGQYFTMKEEYLKEIVEFEKSSKTNKIYLEFKGQNLIVYFDTDKNHKLSIAIDGHFVDKSYCFNYETFLKALQVGGNDIYMTEFISKNNEVGDVWVFKKGNISIFLTGFNLSAGIKLSDDILRRFEDDLNRLDNEIALLNRQAAAES